MSSTTSTYVLTGGTGNTSLHLASLLHSAGHSVILASRSGTSPSPNYTGVPFEWTDSSTYLNALPSSANIKGVYILTPGSAISGQMVGEFVKLARERGVKRFVALTATKTPPHMQEIEDHLHTLEGIEWTVLKPSWFFENFTRQLAHTIKTADYFSSATQEGKLGMVAVEDISAAAFRALTDEKAHNRDEILVGPELISYDQMAEILSEVIGRTITHKKVPAEEYKAFMTNVVGLPAPYAAFLVGMEEQIAGGSEQRLLEENEGRVVKGRITAREFFEKNKALWAKAESK